MYDDLVRGVNVDNFFYDYEFTLLEYDASYDISGNVVEIKYKDVWFVVDNGYLSWSTNIPSKNNGATYKCIRLSKWLESMRKDVECTFGVLKGRFCILQYGI